MERGSTVDSVSVLYVSGPEIDPCVWHILSWKISPSCLFKKSKLSITGERMGTGKLPPGGSLLRITNRPDMTAAV